jgi:hypothetical protein
MHPSSDVDSSCISVNTDRMPCTESIAVSTTSLHGSQQATSIFHISGMMCEGRFTLPAWAVTDRTRACQLLCLQRVSEFLNLRTILNCSHHYNGGDFKSFNNFSLNGGAEL